MATLQEAIDLYISLRDEKEQLSKELKERLKPIDEKMSKIEAKVLQAFDKLGTDSVKTNAGTAYVSRKTSVTTADKESFLKYIKENEEWGLLDVRPLKASIEQYREANDDIPPGLNWREEITVNFRRA